MAKITRSYRGWSLVEKIHGWYACKGSTCVRIAPSRMTNGDDLTDKLRDAVDRFEDEDRHQ